MPGRGGEAARPSGSHRGLASKAINGGRERVDGKGGEGRWEGLPGK